MLKLIISLAIIASTSASISFHCFHKTNDWDIGKIYSCSVQNDPEITIQSMKIDAITGSHISGRSNNDTRGLYINGKTVHYFPKKLNVHFKNLTAIVINVCELKEIYQEDIKVFADLRLLSLYDNYIEVLEKNLFKFNKDLQVIYLGRNKIQFISHDALESLSNLEILYLYENPCIDDSAISKEKVNHLIKKARSQCTADTHLYEKYQVNKRNVLRRSLDLDKLEEENDYLRSAVAGKRNESEILKEHIANLTSDIVNLADLLNRMSQLTFICDTRSSENTWNKVCRAKDLIVSEDFKEVRNIVDLQSKDIDEESVVEVVISYQKCFYIPLKFSSTFENTRKLFVHASELKFLRKDDLSGLTQLDELNLSNNQLKSILNGSFVGLVNLQILDLSENELTSIESGSLDALINLTKLNLLANKFTYFQEKLFAKLVKLRILNISANPLKTLSADFLKCPSQIEEFYAAQCQLTSINISILVCLDNVDTLELLNNDCINLRAEKIKENKNKMKQFFGAIAVDCKL